MPAPSEVQLLSQILLALQRQQETLASLLEVLKQARDNGRPVSSGAGGQSQG